MLHKIITKTTYGFDRKLNGIGLKYVLNWSELLRYLFLVKRTVFICKINEVFFEKNRFIYDPDTFLRSVCLTSLWKDVFVYCVVNFRCAWWWQVNYYNCFFYARNTKEKKYINDKFIEVKMFSCHCLSKTLLLGAQCARFDFCLVTVYLHYFNKLLLKCCSFRSSNNTNSLRQFTFCALDKSKNIFKTTVFKYKVEDCKLFVWIFIMTIVVVDMR